VFRRDQGRVRQPNADDQKVFFGQDPFSALTDYSKDYVFDGSAGEGTRVYIIDTGATLNTPVSYQQLAASLSVTC
jgi:hypothetical protein